MKITVLLLTLLVFAQPSRASEGDEQAFPADDSAGGQHERKDPLSYNPMNGERLPEDNPRFNEPLREERLEEQRVGPAENPHFDERSREERLERERSGRGNPD